ncbi:universal stress protein [Compostimonas suwonensis]|uniref:Nucleotide-binding universal stress UspA family protein n=1 Tax=Compostimonas suwonensis TaxID=1048394 RepID=A0A2M9C0L1_9MICO|nr:universal stress protein [Compostimonas suwonensis]PJJ63888.1 nucleotide-binding universal stress UspA family protein [Compostimonas suwonensis]
MDAADSTDNGLEPVPDNTIVVGHDGSPGADRALALALEYANDLGAPLAIVRAWTIDTAPRGLMAERGYVSSFEEINQVVRDMLVADVREAVGTFPTVAVDYLAVLEHAAKALIDVSARARLLVVGSRGLGGIAGTLLGSVSTECVHRASCPVLVARPRAQQ